MPSRRELLVATGTVASGALAGCTLLERGVPGYVQLKSIQGRYRTNGRQHEESVLRVTLSSPPGERPPEVAFLDGEWESRFEEQREPVVSNSLHADLQQSYETVRYVVGVCSREWADEGEESGCFNVATTRENFNRVQVHDRVRASSDGTFLTIHSVEGKWSFEIE